MIIDTLCFSSGGIQGLLFISSLNYLVDNNYLNLDYITTYVGTSIGSILGFLLNIGYTPKELIYFFLNYDNYDKLEPIFDLFLVENKFGLDNGDSCIELIKNLCKEKINITEITFYELYLLTNKILIINTTNINTGIEYILNYILTPDLSVFLGIRMSISIPIIYTPVLYKNEYYIDGSVSNNILLHLCNPSSTLGFFIKLKKNYIINSFHDILIGSILLVTNKIPNIIDNYKVIIFNINDLTLLFINIDKKYIQHLFNKGISETVHFYINELKKEIIIKKNNIISDILNNIITTIINNN